MVERDFPWSSLHSSSDSSSSFRCSSSFSVSIRHSPSSPPSSVSLQRAPFVLALPTSHLAMHPHVGREWAPSLSWASFLEFYIVLVGTSSNLPFRADPLAGSPIALFIESHRHTKRLATGLHPRDIINSSSDLGSLMTVFLPARLFLIARALVFLRNQPSSPLVTVDWTNTFFISFRSDVFSSAILSLSFLFASLHSSAYNDCSLMLPYLLHVFTGNK